MIITEREKSIFRSIQGDIPIVKRPFLEIANRIGAREEEVISLIRESMRTSTIRKVGAIIRHQKAGYGKNAMMVWAVPSAQCEQVGAALALFKEITHCYQRTPAFMGRYTIFTMVHFKGESEKKVLPELVKAAGTDDYMILYSEQEFKKSSMVYF
jgi:DNA-binding Lrp family transcriptional regulator